LPDGESGNFFKRKDGLSEWIKSLGVICPSGKRAAAADIAILLKSGNSYIHILETMHFDHFYFETTDCAADFTHPF
jgi:hypothetical protein